MKHVEAKSSHPHNRHLMSDSDMQREALAAEGRHIVVKAPAKAEPEKPAAPAKAEPEKPEES